MTLLYHLVYIVLDLSSKHILKLHLQIVTKNESYSQVIGIIPFVYNDVISPSIA